MDDSSRVQRTLFPESRVLCGLEPQITEEADFNFGYPLFRYFFAQLAGGIGMNGVHLCGGSFG